MQMQRNASSSFVPITDIFLSFFIFKVFWYDDVSSFGDMKVNMGSTKNEMRMYFVFKNSIHGVILGLSVLTNV